MHMNIIQLYLHVVFFFLHLDMHNVHEHFSFFRALCLHCFIEENEKKQSNFIKVLLAKDPDINGVTDKSFDSLPGL